MTFKYYRKFAPTRKLVRYTKAKFLLGPDGLLESGKLGLPSLRMEGVPSEGVPTLSAQRDLRAKVRGEGNPAFVADIIMQSIVLNNPGFAHVSCWTHNSNPTQEKADEYRANVAIISSAENMERSLPLDVSFLLGQINYVDEHSATYDPDLRKMCFEKPDEFQSEDEVRLFYENKARPVVGSFTQIARHTEDIKFFDVNPAIFISGIVLFEGLDELDEKKIRRLSEEKEISVIEGNT